MVGTEQGQVPVIMFQRILQAILGTMLVAWVLGNGPAKVHGTEPSHDELLARIQAGDSTAILEAGTSGDPTLIPALEGFLQARSNTVERTIADLIRAYPTEEEGRRSVPPREALMSGEYDAVAQNARTALAKLGVKRYLDEILVELMNPTNSMVFRVWHTGGYRIQVQALKKLAYVNDRSTVKLVAKFLHATESPNLTEPSDVARSPLAAHALAALRVMVDNPPATNDFKLWQQWWEQNKDKYP